MDPLSNIVQKILLTTAFPLLLCITSCKPAHPKVRTDIPLDTGWETIANDSTPLAHTGFEQESFATENWLKVDIPHNWDRYHGYLRKRHGNYHGTAWYRKHFTLQQQGNHARYFLFFEGVGSYATVWVNGHKVGKHAGGRTTFTLDVTPYVHFDQPNLLAVRADHPAEIRDLPWVCGGCSTEVGFSEGSQPLGIFRPVHLVVTHSLRVEPFGVHIWNDTTVTEKHAELNVTAEVKNYSPQARKFTVNHILKDHRGKTVASSTGEFDLETGQLQVFNFPALQVSNPHLWSLEDPYLYQLHTQVVEGGAVVDEVVSPYGIRWISWPVNRKDTTNHPFLLNGKPVFINGVGEYEHLLGNSHAFTKEQIDARVAQIRAAGFNAFRDAHQPHNLRYQQQFDSLGMLWWTQLSAHIWFDTPEFRHNFKQLLRDWVKERRNNPSNIVWGLQNESTLPTPFAEACTQIIREMDPTTSSQRIVTTCNGGTGTDWNVIQNWSGTYGGNPYNYANEISEQWLNGEYGAWRSLDLHTEGPFNPKGVLSEDRMAQLLEIKVQQAESVKEKCCGQFLWIFSSHDNPGRIQSGEAYRDIDRLGPINYKGLQTPWGEPADAYYMYQSHYTSPTEAPMVYIVSHTWPNRWKTAGVKDSITIYSNCDAVSLFNDTEGEPLATQQRRGPFQPFVFTNVSMQYNLLKAMGYVKGKAVTEDVVVLQNLPVSPHFQTLYNNHKELLQSAQGQHYLYRVNCGGGAYTDSHGNHWEADRAQTQPGTWGSRSWTDVFDNLPAYYGSQRRTFDPIQGTRDWKLFQNFRYGRDELAYHFPLPKGTYTVELYFTEPWYGTGSKVNCQGWRLFDIALNDAVVEKDLDIWAASGHDGTLKKTYTVQVDKGHLDVHFPKVTSGQAMVSAIAISTQDSRTKPAPGSPLPIQQLEAPKGWEIQTWADWGDAQYTGSPELFQKLPSNLFSACWIKTVNSPGDKPEQATFVLTHEADVFVALDERITERPTWLQGYSKQEAVLENNAPEHFRYALYSQRFPAGAHVVLGENGTLQGQIPNMYTVFVQPASALGAPTDQRPVKQYSSKEAHIRGNAIKRTVDGRDFIEVKTNGTVEITWKFYVGLASNYGIHFKFQNNTPGAVHPRMHIQTVGGIAMTDQEIEMYHRPGKWRTVKANTGTTINAGDYTVTLQLTNAKGLLVQRMEVQ